MAWLKSSTSPWVVAPSWAALSLPAHSLRSPGCSNGGNTASSGSGTATDSSASGDNVMSFYLSEPAYIDPYNAQENQGTAVVRAVFDGLVTWDWDTNEPKAMCATDLPEVSEDGLTYTFHLREGMTFHNGDPVDAASFKRGWERLADGTMSAPSEIGYHLAPVAGYAEMAAGEATEITGLTCPDELTFQVQLTDPMGDFVAVCCHPGLVPVPQAALDDPASFLEQPIGNRPLQDGRGLAAQPVHLRLPLRRLLRRGAQARRRVLLHPGRPGRRLP